MAKVSFRLDDVDVEGSVGDSMIYGSLRLEDKNKGYDDRSFCFCQCDPQCECNTECRKNVVDWSRVAGPIIQCPNECRCEGMCRCEDRCRCDCKSENYD